MDIDSIKQLIKNGEFPEAHDQLRKILSQTPEDTIAQMLYGTCCQLMGDSATFGRIYRDLAPEMELRVAHGERSERVSMWLKYAAMFAVVFSLVCSASGADEGISSAAIGCPTNGASAVVAENNSNLYDSVLKMPLRDQFRFFLNRPEVSRELHKGKLRAVVIPIQGTEAFDGKSVDKLLLIRVSSSLKTGSDIVEAFEDLEGADGAAFVQFSSFEQAVNPKAADVDAMISIREKQIRFWEERMRKRKLRNADLEKFIESKREEIQCLRKGEMMPSSCVSRHKVLRRLEEHGDVSDLIVSSDGPDSHVLGISIKEPTEPSLQARPRYMAGRVFKRPPDPPRPKYGGPDLDF